MANFTINIRIENCSKGINENSTKLNKRKKKNSQEEPLIH
jgi:hypothetical protein